MSMKINLCYLSNESLKVLLENSLTALFECGWTYNVHLLGYCSYWTDGPIWDFGESENFEETITDKKLNLNRIKALIAKVSDFYSPSIILGIEINGNIVSGNLNIVEEDGEWKQICFTIDRDNILDRVPGYIQNKNKDFIYKIFLSMSDYIDPCYGLCGTELEGVTLKKEKDDFRKMRIADAAFFSRRLNIDSAKFFNGSEKFLEINSLKGFILKRKINFMELYS
ncbi:hypothetical protein [Saccharibacillus brassicae]|uniref:Uncharacterized protein n=1 Tax=Saccharibacillus brassicae TaxID=2583377 RepID=A0A4Y6V013_SACBS|nr:hypothetical protein [Saccharibacillus brassicae]QDH21605.1 hypothetical protein FFV09_12580 [Saccharibacillus brassicae]